MTTLPKKIGVYRYESILTLIKDKAASNMSNDSLLQILNRKRF